MKRKFYKTLLTFIAGILVGVTCTFLYQVFGRPVMPEVEKCKLNFKVDYDKMARVILDAPVKRWAEPNLWPGLEVKLLGVYDKKDKL